MMIRSLFCGLAKTGVSGLVARSSENVKQGICLISSQLKNQNSTFSSLVLQPVSARTSFPVIPKYEKNSFLKPKESLKEQIRTVIKFSINKAKRKTVRTVPCRFFRLNWGIWIRTIAGRRRKLWLKSNSAKTRALQHVFCNATQTRMLDKMVNRFWRKPKYYIDDPYEPYHKRENFYITRTKPWRPEGCDYE